MPRFRLNVNGKLHQVEAEADATLVSVLRDQLDLTGTKEGCGEGLCGACTVLIDGRAALACATTIAEVKDRAVLTIEGLEQKGRLHPVQEAFLEAAAFQCGFCTPGMIMEAVALLRTRPKPGEADILRAMDGHICRCGTYPRIVEAVQLAAKGGRRG